MGFVDTYNYLLYDLADERTLNWPFNGSPIPLVLLSIAYLLFTLKIGPALMQNRPGYSLRTYTRLYDVAQIIINSAVIYAVYSIGWFSKVGLICHSREYGHDPIDVGVCNITWWVFIVKIIDYSETVVFVLRKNYRQISFLHLYHHITTVWLAWYVLRYFCVKMTIFFVLVNCAVHVIMYTYYLAATFGPTVLSYIRSVKPFITIVQMVQFCILLMYSLNVFMPNCWDMYPLAIVMTLNLLVNFYLFYDFYKKSYKKPKQK